MMGVISQKKKKSGKNDSLREKKSFELNFILL